MNKTVIGAIVAVVVIAGGAFLIFGRGGDDSTTQNSQTNQTATESEQPSDASASTSSASLRSLADGSEPRECSMTYSGPSGTGDGLMYADGKGRARMHIDLSTAEGNSGTIDQIVEGTTATSWFTTETGQKIGFKLDLGSADSPDTPVSNTPSNNSVPADQNFEVDCKAWTVDEAQFKVPSDVQFIDASGSGLNPTLFQP